MAVALVGVIELESIGEFGEEGTGIFGERVEVEVVDGNTQKLHRVYQHE
jgi:hypothetical protein